MKTLKVRYAHWPPWAMDVPTENGTVLSGVLKDVFGALSSALRYKFQIQRQEKRLFGARQPDGTYNGILGELARKEIDIGGPFVASEERAVVVDFTNCLEISKLGIITGIQSADRNMFLYIKVFSWKVWLSLFVTVVFCTLISILIYDVSVNGWKSNQGLLLSNYCWTFWCFLVGQNAGPTDHWPLRDVWYRHSFRILLATWLLGPVIISLHTFQGKTTSTFAITKFRPVVSGLEELRTKRGIIPVITKGSAVEICFKSREEHIDIWRRMQNDTIQFSAETVEDTLLKVEKGTHILFLDYVHALGIVSNWVKREGRCSIQVQETSLCQNFIALGIRKDFQRDEKKRMNSLLTYIIQAKLTDRWLNRVFNKYTHCTHKLQDESKPLDVTDILGGFVMWVIGITAAIVTLIAEIITFKTLMKMQS